MNSKYLQYFLLISNIWFYQKAVHAELDPYDMFTSDVFSNCDYTHFESQLEVLKTGNEYLKLRLHTMQSQLDKQRQLWQNLENKLDQIKLYFENINNEILTEIKERLSEVNESNQLQQSRCQTPAVDDKWHIVADIKEGVKNNGMLLETFGAKIKFMESTLNKISREAHIQALVDISKNLTLLQKFDKKLTNIENSTNTKTNFNKIDTAKICVRSEDGKLVCTTQHYPTNCAEFNENYCSNSKCRIQNHLFGPDPFLVACDDLTEGGGWTVIQRRINGSVDFYRDWSEYKNGFGHIDGEFFIGLDKLNALTTLLQPVELLIQLEDFNGIIKYAKYSEFHVGNETEKYKLNTVGKYTGNAGDSFSPHRGNYFTTKDRDNDISFLANCAVLKQGAWWYGSCFSSNLNGKYHGNGGMNSTSAALSWGQFNGIEYSLKYVQMSIRPKRI